MRNNRDNIVHRLRHGDIPAPDREDLEHLARINSPDPHRPITFAPCLNRLQRAGFLIAAKHPVYGVEFTITDEGAAAIEKAGIALLMSYASKQDMIDRIGERDLMLLTDRDGALDAIDDTVLTTRLEDATAQINGYLVKRHALPFDETPRVLIGLTCDIAYYNLLGTQSGASESATRRYDQAIAFLRQVARGEASLGDETPADIKETSPGAVLVEGPEPTFSRKSLGGF